MRTVKHPSALHELIHPVGGDARLNLELGRVVEADIAVNLPEVVAPKRVLVDEIAVARLVAL